MEEDQKKKSFWNNKKTVKGKALSAWVIVMILIFMLFTFGVGIFLGKEIFVKKPDDTNKESNVENTETDTNTEVDEKAHNSYKEKNGEFYSSYSQSVFDQNFGLSIYVLEDQKSVRINISKYGIKDIYQIDMNNDLSKVLTFDKKVIQVLFGEFGQGAGAETILFLMEDGSVEYIPFYKEISKSNWNTLSDAEKMNSYGAIKGVTNVVMLYNMTVDSDLSGYNSVGATRKDGTFYNLYDFDEMKS